MFLSWRMLGTDPESITFNVYRASGKAQAIKLNDKPLTASTSFLDTNSNPATNNDYFIRPLLDGQEMEPSSTFKVPANAPVQTYASIPLRTPEHYSPNDASVGDLDGDGEYEIVLHQASRGRDNSQAGRTGEPILDAYKLDGTFLWRINLGKNIREGAHYTQFLVYDLDGDGRAELVCKTADGTVDGTGQVIGDAQADHRNRVGICPGRAGIPHRLRRADGPGDRHDRLPAAPGQGRRLGRQLTATGSTGSWPAWLISTASGPAS